MRLPRFFLLTMLRGTKQAEILERRSGYDRRQKDRPRFGKDRRSGMERRKAKPIGIKPRIPIFIKLVILSTLLTVSVVSSISFFVLQRQQEQFTRQLISLGNSMVRIVSDNAPDKLLGEDDLLLLQLVSDIADDEQVVSSLITDWRGVVKAHSGFEGIGNAYHPPEALRFIEETDDIRLSSFLANDEDFLFFEKDLTYQNIPIGRVYLTMSQQKIHETIKKAEMFIIVLTLITVVLGIVLSFVVSIYFSIPIRKLQESTHALAIGDFEHQVAIRRNDELGDLGRAFNRMVNGLKERERMRLTLNLAKDVQQNLLPKTIPVVPGLDIAGKSIFCDETGGDYYDFLDAALAAKGQIGITIGDVTGHGVPAALLMATARAFLRQLSSRNRMTPDAVVAEVNRQLARDVRESGRFMTLFYLTVDIRKKELFWVRAGHDPAIFYDPVKDSYQELRGSGMALGVDELSQYQVYRKTGLAPGQIVLLTTDGIWEALNSEGQMFGKDSIYDLLRQNKNQNAAEILDAILASLKEFQGGVPSQDDVTIVVLKLK